MIRRAMQLRVPRALRARAETSSQDVVPSQRTEPRLSSDRFPADHQLFLLGASVAAFAAAGAKRTVVEGAGVTAGGLRKWSLKPLSSSQRWHLELAPLGAGGAANSIPKAEEIHHGEQDVLLD